VAVQAGKRSGRQVLLQLRAPRIGQGYVIAACGGHPALGNWDPAQALMLSDHAFPLWQGRFALSGPQGPVRYKYVILDAATREAVEWESGEDRVLDPGADLPARAVYVQTDEQFRYARSNWRGAGVAMPVFSLRSSTSTGIGEFTDLNLLVDWAAASGIRMVQILPINDTVATHSWKDSYPYAAISVFALHPIYLNPEAMGRLNDPQEMAWFKAEQARLNQDALLDYVEVTRVKSRYFKLLYDQDHAACFAEPGYAAYFEANRDWLVPYAVFSCLRDRFGTADFSQWPEYSSFDRAEAEAFAAPDQPHHHDVAIHYFIQYHLHKQLLGASEYARSKGVVLKGDIPIGIYRHSVDAWTAPHLYHMNAQAGAPPDAFAVAGQNWRFPTYNWKVMAEDGYAWWRSRMTQLSVYFDAFRIDHILGFFRIWEIPGHAAQGLMGYFNPCLPLTRTELASRGVWLDYDRMCKPYIREHMLGAFFGSDTDRVRAEFLDQPYPGIYELKPHVATQRQVEAYTEQRMQESPEEADFYRRVQEPLYSLISEVIFLEVPNTRGEGFSPRIAMHFTWSYRELDDRVKAALNEIYTDFFFRRHEDFWREQAMVKLPAIKYATDMLVCGEDLGMVPACVPGVMKELGILSLEIQRMPKGSGKEFDHPGDAPYLSVVSTSTHDMSTIRGWWEEDRGRSQRFYSQILGRGGNAPFFCEPWVARDIVVQHLYSPAMWAVFPLQDLLAMHGGLRRQNPHEEQINVPADPDHLWRYRMHLTLEELLRATDFADELRALTAASGRNRPY
jgi:4-alpha-glucanotransferase